MKSGCLALLLAGCVTGNPQPFDDERPVLEGGTLRFATCGTTLTTRVGASAPELATPQVGADPTPRSIHLGLAGDPSTSMVVQWRTVDETTRATTVEYGPTGGASTHADGATFVYNGLGPNSPLVRVHEVHLCGLTPDTEYSYRVGGPTVFSESFRFRTAPSPTADEEVVIGIVGDTRNGYDVWAEVVAKMDEIGAPALIVFTGDAVTLGQYQPEWDSFFAVAEPTLRRVPIISAHGNHDTMSVNFFSLFAMPGNEEDYAFDYGAAHFTVLNDSPLDLADLAPGARIAQFLDADLTAASGRPWKLVAHHRPTWSAAANHGSDEALRGALGPIFDEHHVDLVINGHDHDYERTHAMFGNGMAASTAEGTVYLVSGGAGATLYEPGKGFWTAVSEKKSHFVLMKVRPGRLELRAYDVGGAMFDELILTK